MLKTNEDFIALFVLSIILMPGLWGLVFALFKLLLRKIHWSSDDVKLGVAIHALNTAISPGIPAYLLHLDKQTGGGSVASLLSIFLIPVTWLIYLKSKHLFATTESSSKETTTYDFTSAVAGAISQHEQGQHVNQICPACTSVIRIHLSASPDGKTPALIKTDCACGGCSGAFGTNRLI